MSRTFGLLRGLSLVNVQGTSPRSSSGGGSSSIVSRSVVDDDSIVSGMTEARAVTAQSFRRSKATLKLKSILKRPLTEQESDGTDGASAVSAHNPTVEHRRTGLAWVESTSRRPVGRGDSHHSGSTLDSASSGRRLLRRVHHHVGFGSVNVREYARTIGDHPSVSSGPPLSLDWEYDPHETRYDIDTFEALQRPLRRSSEAELAVPRQIREEWLLYEWQVPQAVVAAAVMDVVKVKNQRRQTIHKLTTGWNKVDQLVSRSSFKVPRPRKPKSVASSNASSRLSTVPTTASDSAHMTQGPPAAAAPLLPREEDETSTSFQTTETDSAFSKESNPLDQSFDYGSYYRLSTPNDPVDPLPAVALTVAPAVVALTPNVDDARLAELAAKLWHSAAVSKAKKTILEYNDDDMIDTNDEFYVDPDGYHPSYLVRSDTVRVATALY